MVFSPAGEHYYQQSPRARRRDRLSPIAGIAAAYQLVLNYRLNRKECKKVEPPHRLLSRSKSSR